MVCSAIIARSMSPAAIAGHGVALCPVEVFSREIATGDVVVLSDIATMEDESYFVVTRTRSRVEIGLFVEWFATSVRALSGPTGDPAPSRPSI